MGRETDPPAGLTLASVRPIFNGLSMAWRNGKLTQQVSITALLLLLLCAGCSSLRRAEPAVDRTNDVQIREQVQARMDAEPVLGRGSIRVEVDGGTVLLYGSVTGMGAWGCAIRNAELVPNVRTVVDYLVIERGPREANCLAPRS
jgi:hypothetical protein